MKKSIIALAVSAVYAVSVINVARAAVHIPTASEFTGPDAQGASDWAHQINTGVNVLTSNVNSMTSAVSTLQSDMTTTQTGLALDVSR